MEDTMKQTNTIHGTTILRQETIERDPSFKMPLTERIHSFDYVSWSAMVLMFTSIWQIAIPYSWVDSGTEKWLGSISILIFIYSVVILAWAKHNHSIHKDFYAKSLLQHKAQNPSNSNPTSVQELIRPSTILDFNELDKNGDDDEKNIEIAGIGFAQFSFILSLMIIILLSGLLIGNEMFEGYFKAIEEANHIFSVENDDAKKTSVLLLSQTLCTLLTIMNFLYIAYEISQLILFPHNFSAYLNYFICSFCCISTLLFFFHIYLQNYIKVKGFNTLQHTDCIGQIGVISFIGGIASIVYMFYNFFNSRSKKPNQKMYVWYILMYFIVSGVVFAQSLIIYMDVRNSSSNFHGNCMATLTDYSQDFLYTIGCPSKYYRDQTYPNHSLYTLNCNEEYVGLVWEEDLQANVTSKINNRSCININCCKLIGEFSSVQFWTFIILSTMFCTNSLVIFFFTLIIYTQKDKQSIKVSPKLLSSTKFAVFVILVITFVSISCVAFLFLDLEGMTAPPKRPNLPSKLQQQSFSDNTSHNNFNHNSTSFHKNILNKNYKYHDLTIGDNFNFIDQKNTTGNNQVYQDIIPQSQIKGCRLASKYLEKSIDFPDYNNNNCNNNKTDKQINQCNYKSGYNVCLGGKHGAFSLASTFKSENIRIKEFNVWDPYRIVKGKEGQIKEDELCFSATSNSCLTFITQNLYFCVDENLKDSDILGYVYLKQLKQEILHFPSQSDPMSLLENEPQEYSENDNNNNNNNKSLHSNYLSHGHSSNKDDKNKEEKDIINHYEPGDKNWVNIQVFTFGAENGITLSESEVLIFPNQTDCTLHNFDTQYPIRKQITNQIGTTYIYNLPWGLNYTIHYRHDDYLYNCILFNSMSAGSGTTYEINAPLIKRFKDKESFKVLLYWSTPLLSLRLSATYNAGTTFQCQVGFYQNECGGMKSQHSQSTPAQVITIEDIGQYEYLFYVEHIQEYQNLRNTQDYSEIELLQEDKIHLKQLNSLFYQSGAAIKVYVKERALPVSEYKLPPVLHSQIMRQSTTWLALCMDGKIGSISQSPLNKYWEKVKKPNQYWESPQGRQVLPDSSICSKYFNSTKQI